MKQTLVTHGVSLTNRTELTISIKTRATIEDLYKVEGKAELVNGEIVHTPPAGDEPGRAMGTVPDSV